MIHTSSTIQNKDRDANNVTNTNQLYLPKVSLKIKLEKKYEKFKEIFNNFQ